jgi:hypothetical protein
MSRVRDELPPATASEALSALTVDELRGLGVGATGEKPRGRKAELVALLAAWLADGSVRRLYESLDEVDRAAVAEATHNGVLGRFSASRFRAKYGRDPGWARSRRSRGR